MGYKHLFVLCTIMFQEFILDTYWLLLTSHCDGTLLHYIKYVFLLRVFMYLCTAGVLLYFVKAVRQVSHSSNEK